MCYMCTRAAHRPSKTGVMQKSDVYTKEIACGVRRIAWYCVFNALI